MSIASFLLLPLIFPASLARLHHALPEDTYAFPKHRVTFLNGLPIRSETAQYWLNNGLKGGELEFLEKPWQDVSKQSSPAPKAIGSGEQHSESSTPTVSSTTPDAFSLQKMKLGPETSYLCFIPVPTEDSAVLDEKVEPEEATPDHSWSLLQPLSGRCLYHKQGWFTYSYCHNEKIRQFKELPHSHPHPPGGYIPEEDPDVSDRFWFPAPGRKAYLPKWQAYTLGVAPPAPEPGVDLTVAERSSITANLELSRESGSRYLVQRWGDGTICDKTGRMREVEVQFHCSMTVTDTILFIKEAKTCSYVLVIHTPRLCAEPGFKSRFDSHQETVIRCREIVKDSTSIQVTHDDPSESQFPVKTPRRKMVAEAPPENDDSTIQKKGSKDSAKDVIRKALEAIIGDSNDADFSHVVFGPAGENGEMMLEFTEKFIDNGHADRTRPAAQDSLQGDEKDDDKSKKLEKKPPRNLYDEL